MQYFNIQLASQLSGVASATIRAWEKRYQAVVPQRGENKHRLYSEKDIEKLALLYKLTELGQSIGKIAHLDFSELKEIYSALLHRPYEEKHVMTPLHENVDFEKILSSFQLALATYKLDIISHELEKTRALLTPKDLCLKVIVPLFHEIGNKVAKGELSIAQEHTLSALVSFHVGQLIGQHYQKVLHKQEVILITTPQGELHEIGILASALLCVHYGLKFIYMGANLPAESLAEAANALGVKTILLGVTMGQEMGSGALENYLSEVQRRLTVKVSLWVGGNLRPGQKSELEKRKISYFPSLHSLSDYFEKNF